MSWKNVKTHYRIGHTVHITDQGICIGSPYIHNIIVIGLDGKIKKRYEDRSNEDLRRYQSEMDADPQKLAELIAAPDTFEVSLPIYTYEDGTILLKSCEAYGWPNVTHDGCLIYENTFSPDRAVIVERAKRNADLGIKFARENIAEAEKRLAECRAYLAKEEAARAKLEADFPSAPAAGS